ncbi:MAG: class I SAM-dependent methyltransferase [Bacteroidetes bacterium]|nr:class I SAM-dependent methyltransferase [Bacteroidota bacterium]
MSEFDEKAREWDKNRMHLDRTIAIAAHLQNMVDLKPGMKALEFGAGTGLLSFYLKDMFSAITLMDSSQEMLNMAEQKMDEADRSKFRTIYFDLEKENFTVEPFDILYSQMVLHHIRDTEAIFGKFYNLLSPGGILAIADLYQEDGSFHDGDVNVHHGFDPENLKDMIVKTGFSEVKISSCFVIRKLTSEGSTAEYPVFLLTARK